MPNTETPAAPRNTEKQLVGRLTVASRILSGLVANPNVVGFNHNCGWSLVNCTDADIAGYALKLADELIAANASREVRAPARNLGGVVGTSGGDK